MAQFYGLLIVREASGAEHTPLVIAQETLSIGSDASCDLVLAGLQPRHAVLLCHPDRQAGGISLVNTSSLPITVEQRQNIELYTATGSTNGSGSHDSIASRPYSLDSGAACPVNTATLIDLGTYTLEFRLAPGVRNRPEAEDRGDATFDLKIASLMLPIETTTVANEQATSHQELKLKLLPGEDRALEIIATSTTSHVQDIIFDDIVWDESSNLPIPSWVDFARRRLKSLQTSSVDRQTGYNALLLTPPRHPSSRAGEYKFRINAYSLLASAKVNNRENRPIHITLLPYVDLLATMHRRKLSALRSGVYLLELQNNSNWNVPLLLDLSNREDALQYEVIDSRDTSDLPSHAERQGRLPQFKIVPIAAGQQITLTVVVRPRRRWPFGRSASHPFTLTTTADIADRGDLLAQQTGSTDGYKHVRALALQNDRSVAPIVIEAELVQRRVPYLALLMLLVLLVLLVLLAVPSIPRTVADYVAGYRPADVARGPLVQTTVLDGLVVVGNTTTLRAPLAGTLVQLGVPGTCVPSPSIATNNACYVAQRGPVGLINVDPQLVQLNDTIAAIDKASQTITGTEALWYAANAQAGLDLERARQDVLRLGPEGGQSELRQATDQLQTAEAQLREMSNQLSQAKTQAEVAQSQAATELQKAQRAREDAFRNLDWVQKHGTHPIEQYMVGGRLVPRPLTQAEKQQFSDAKLNAERVLTDTAKLYDLAIHAYVVAHDKEITQLQQAQRAVDEARIRQDTVARGNSKELLDAVHALRKAEVAAEAAARQGAAQLDAGLDAAQTIFNQLRKDYPAIMAMPERQADAQLVERQIAAARRLLADAQAAPTATSEQTPTVIAEWDAALDQRIKAAQAHMLDKIDTLIQALGAVRDLTIRVQEALGHMQRIELPAGAHIVELHAHAGDQLAAGAPLLTYYADRALPQVLAQVDPKLLGGLQPVAQVYTSTSTLAITMSIGQLPALYDSTGKPQAISQTLVLSGDLGLLPLYTPVKARVTHVVQDFAELIVPEGAIVGEGENTAVLVRRPIVDANHWLALMFPPIAALRLDARIPIQAGARAGGKAVVTVADQQLRPGDRVLVK